MEHSPSRSILTTHPVPVLPCSCLHLWRWPWPQANQRDSPVYVSIYSQQLFLDTKLTIAPVEWNWSNWSSFGMLALRPCHCGAKVTTPAWFLAMVPYQNFMLFLFTVDKRVFNGSFKGCWVTLTSIRSWTFTKNNLFDFCWITWTYQVIQHMQGPGIWPPRSKNLPSL